MSLEEVQQTGLNLLKSFCEYCQLNNYSFFLSNGTLLGAIKYKGYIPWDDDVDVFMPREDYNLLINSFENTDTIQLLSHERNSKYGYPFAKYCDATTLKIESYQPIIGDVNQGVCIDVFPLDHFSNSKMIAKLQAFYNSIKVTLFSLSQLDSYDNSFLKRCVYRLSKIIGYERLLACMLKAPKLKKKKSKYIGNRVWAVYGSKEVVESESFTNTVTVLFEGFEFPAPVGYHSYLTSLYGDYKKDPPVDKQKTHHLFKAYKL